MTIFKILFYMALGLYLYTAGREDERKLHVTVNQDGMHDLLRFSIVEAVQEARETYNKKEA